MWEVYDFMSLICYMFAFLYKSKYTSLYLDHVCVLLLKKESPRLGGWNRHEWTTQLRATSEKHRCAATDDEIFQHKKAQALAYDP